MTFRRSTRRLSRLAEHGVRALWLASAAGHAAILAATWSRLSGTEALMLLVATVASAAFVPLSRWICERPLRLLVIALLVLMVHVPAEGPIEVAMALAPVLLVAWVACAPAGLGLVCPAPAGWGFTASPSLHRPAAPSLGVALRRRPPPLL